VDHHTHIILPSIYLSSSTASRLATLIRTIKTCAEGEPGHLANLTAARVPPHNQCLMLSTSKKARNATKQSSKSKRCTINAAQQWQTLPACTRPHMPKPPVTHRGCCKVKQAQAPCLVAKLPPSFTTGGVAAVLGAAVGAHSAWSWSSQCWASSLVQHGGPSWAGSHGPPQEQPVPQVLPARA